MWKSIQLADQLKVLLVDIAALDQSRGDVNRAGDPESAMDKPWGLVECDCFDDRRRQSPQAQEIGTCRGAGNRIGAA